MRPELLRILLVICFALSCLCVSAQTAETCDGSLGDPVIHQDFGSGATTFGPQLPSERTKGITYVTNTCPSDGQYTIIHSLAGNDNCHQDTWHNVYSDHT